jgi:hypothetical protein
MTDFESLAHELYNGWSETMLNRGLPLPKSWGLLSGAEREHWACFAAAASVAVEDRVAVAHG